MTTKKNSNAFSKLLVIFSFILMVAGAFFISNYIFCQTTSGALFGKVVGPLLFLGLLFFCTGTVLFFFLLFKAKFREVCEKGAIATLVLWVMLMLTFLGIIRIFPKQFFPKPIPKGKWFTVNLGSGINQYWSVYRSGEWRHLRRKRSYYSGYMQSGPDHAPGSQYLPAILFTIFFAFLLSLSWTKRSRQTSQIANKSSTESKGGESDPDKEK